VHCEYTNRYGYLASVNREKIVDVAVGAALVVCWSSGFVGAQLGTRTASAVTLLAWRFLVAALLLGAVAILRRRRFDVAALRRHAVLGLLIQALYLGGVVSGIGLGVPAGTAALIAATQPLLVAIARPEPTAARQRWGLAVGLVGVGLVVAGDLGPGTAPLWAFLLPAAGTVALAAGTLLERRWRPAQGPLDALTLQTLTAAVVVVPSAAATGRLQPPADPTFWWAVAWTVGMASFGGYGAYLATLRRGGPMRASTLLYLTPPATAVWALALFGQIPGPLAVPGMVCAAVGAALVLVPNRAAAERDCRQNGATDAPVNYVELRIRRPRRPRLMSSPRRSSRVEVDGCG
jgi:drug/metabolite transporter (DMT)-like permease